VQERGLDEGPALEASRLGGSHAHWNVLGVAPRRVNCLHGRDVRAGRLIRDHATTLVYDAYDQLRAVVPGPSDDSNLPLTNLPVEELSIPGGLTSPNVEAENAAAQVTGGAVASDGTAHTLYWSGTGAAVDVSAAGGVAGRAYPSGLNASGTIVGSRSLSDSSWEPYIVTPSSAPNGVPAVTYPGKDGPGDTYPYAVNASGQFAGYHGAFFGPRQAFRYTPGAGYVEIPGFGGTWIDAWGIDDAGNVFGNSSLPDTPMQNLADPIHFGHALEFHSDTQQSEDLNTLVDPVASPGWVLFTAHDGVGEYVYGLGRLDGTDLAYRLNKVTGEVTPIGPLGGTMLVNRANHFGDVVGTGWKQAGFVDQTAWAYIHDQFIDLNDVIDPMSGWHLIAANDINDNGDVVGRGTFNGVQKAFRLRLPLRTSGGKGPTLAEAHTYGYDGLRTSTTTMNVDGSNVKSQYWFSQDYTETTSGNREHYVRVGSRIVAKVIMKPGGAPAAVLPTSFKFETTENRSEDEWPQFGLGAFLLLIGAAGASGRVLWKKRGWMPATASVVALVFTVASCEMFGANDAVRSALWHWDRVGDDAPRYFHGGIEPGPVVITASDGLLYEERRYEPFGQSVDARFKSGAIGLPDFLREPQNILGKLTDANTGWSYHGARWLSPQMARWSAPDPKVKGPLPDFMLSPWDLNPYAYVSQKPTILWDPTGMEGADGADGAGGHFETPAQPAPSSDRPFNAEKGVSDFAAGRRNFKYAPVVVRDVGDGSWHAGPRERVDRAEAAVASADWVGTAHAAKSSVLGAVSAGTTSHVPGVSSGEVRGRAEASATLESFGQVHVSLWSSDAGTPMARGTNVSPRHSPS
jgi:RHS repeat-associated protein